MKVGEGTYGALIQENPDNSVGDSPGGPLKQMGKSHLKPAKNQG
jgi:hypothetical protein